MLSQIAIGWVYDATRLIYLEDTLGLRAGRDARDALEAGVVQRAVVAASAATGVAALARGTFVAIIDLVAAAPARDTVHFDSGLGSRTAATTPDGDGLVLCRQNAGFDVLQLAFDGATGRRLAVAGLRTVQARQAPDGCVRLIEIIPEEVLRQPSLGPRLPLALTLTLTLTLST